MPESSMRGFIDTVAAKGMPTASMREEEPVYLRIGTWDPSRPFSGNYARGETEAGLSVYALDGDQKPVVPTDGEWAEEDMQDRLASDLPKFLVQGMVVGTGHDGEPLLGSPVVVGIWRGDAG